MTDKVLPRLLALAALFGLIAGCRSTGSSIAPATNPPAALLPVIDIHNHDAADARYLAALPLWEKYGITQVVLFGRISQPAAQDSDRIAQSAARSYPDRIIPFIAGVDINNPDCPAYIQRNFEQGARGVGEIVAASSYSPATANLPWKARDAMDPRLQPVYAICGRYQRPVLLHIDPPDSYQIGRFLAAASAFPDTNFIFGHANAYTAPADLERILAGSGNTYIDFFAGFTAFNPESRYQLADFLPIIAKYPSRFMVSSDSGYGVGYEKAYQAIRELLKLLDPPVAQMLAHENFERLLAKSR